MTTLRGQFNRWLKDWNIAEEQQWYDNTPLRIADSFAAFVPRQVTEQQLAERLWWWRYATDEQWQVIFQHPDIPDQGQILAPLFRDIFELSAFYYEMRARYDDRYRWDFDRPWIKCSREQRRMLQCLWPNRGPALQFLPTDVGSPNWVDFKMTLNLHLNDKTLKGLIAEELSHVRHASKIPNPGYGRGVRRRPWSWRPVECCDRRHFQGIALDESERSQLSKARRDYEAACRRVRLDP